MSLSEIVKSIINKEPSQNYKVFVDGELLETAKPKTTEEVGEILQVFADSGLEYDIYVEDMQGNEVLDYTVNKPEERETMVVTITFPESSSLSKERVFRSILTDVFHAERFDYSNDDDTNFTITIK